MPVETITTIRQEQLRAKDFAWRADGAVRLLVCTPLEEAGFTNAFSTRTGGVSPMPEDALNLAGFTDDAAENIHENRRRFLRALGGEWRLASTWQVHGADVRRVREDHDEERNDRADEQCDALTTNVPGILVAAKHADCVPVLLADERTGACAAVHAGWRGTLAGILGRTLSHMREEYGTRAEDVRAALGPAALGCCYEVGAEVTDAFKERYGETFATPTRDAHALIDLHRANTAQLLAAGLTSERIHRAPYCTICRPDLFFSYRLEKHKHGSVGRLLSVIGAK